MGEWLPIDKLFNFEKGILQSSKCIPGDFDFITAAEEWKTHNEFTHDCEALIFAMGASGSLGRTHYVNGKFISSDLCFILTPKENIEIDLKFYYRIFNFLREDIVKKTATGTSKLAINQTNFSNYLLPYFDIEHQQSFSEKLERISDIKNSLSYGFNEQSDYLKLLRQSILQEAIEGKLTAEWRKVHPVVKGDPDYDSKALLEAVKKEKAKLIAEGKLKKEKPLPEITDSEMHFNLPEGWVWCRLGEIINSITYGTSQSCSYDDTQNSAILRIPNISKGYIDLDDLKYTNLSQEEIKELKLREGDLLVIRSNGSSEIVGTSVLVLKYAEGFCYAGYLIRLRFSDLKIGNYISKIMKSTWIRDQIETPLRTTVGINNINSQEISNLIISLPPLTEQQAIIDRIDSLLVMVDVLEKQVNERKVLAEELMQSVLREAFG